MYTLQALSALWANSHPVTIAALSLSLVYKAFQKLLPETFKKAYAFMDGKTHGITRWVWFNVFLSLSCLAFCIAFPHLSIVVSILQNSAVFNQLLLVLGFHLFFLSEDIKSWRWESTTFVLSLTYLIASIGTPGRLLFLTLNVLPRFAIFAVIAQQSKESLAYLVQGFDSLCCEPLQSLIHLYQWIKSLFGYPSDLPPLPQNTERKCKTPPVLENEPQALTNTAPLLQKSQDLATPNELDNCCKAK